MNQFQDNVLSVLINVKVVTQVECVQLVQDYLEIILLL
jgi:hypothetical protein